MEAELAVPERRRLVLERIVKRLQRAERVALTTHVNADGDGVGSQIALAVWLNELGHHVRIVNPTPFPDAFRFLVPDASWIADAAEVAGEAALRHADVLVVLDTAEPSRIGRVAKHAKGRDIIVIDHHVEADTVIPGELLMDVTACATGELVYDLMQIAGLPRPWPEPLLAGIYTAMVTDTGSFRFSNTTPRAHAVAGDLLRQGVDPEQMYRRIYATVPLRRIELLREALERLECDEEYPITWISIEQGLMERLGTTSEDLEGVIDHARSVEGTEVAILFRETADGATKVSFRSAGDIDVNVIARQFGGGGHVKASGALIGEGMKVARPHVLDATRRALHSAGLHFRGARTPA